MARAKAARRAGRGPAGRPPQESRPNPFEARLGVRKDDVLGRKRKHGREKAGSARDQGLEKRKGTLLVEYKLRNKANSFVDRRIGEHDSTLTEEDKAIARFQRQRFKDLAAEEGARDLGAEEPLFGFGSRADAEASDDGSDGAAEGFGGSDDDDQQLASDFGGGFVRKAGGGEAPAEEPQQKSKKQVMEELIAKSKAHKAEKAQQRDADLDETEALDRDLGELMQAGALRGLLKGKGQAAAAAQRPLDAAEQAYDADRRGLVFEAKAKAGEKLEQPEQQAGEQEEPAEDPRQALPSGDADEPAEALPAGGYALRRAKMRQRQREEEQAEAAAGEGSEGGSDEGSEDGSEPGGSDAEAEAEPAAEREQLGAEPPQQPADAAAADEPAKQKRAAGTGAFPETYEQYLAEAGERPAAELDAALRTLRATVRNAAADGGRRLQVLCGYAIQHFADAAGARPPAMAALDVLTQHIAELSRQVPLYAVSAAQARLARLQQRLSRTLAPETDGAEQQGERGWPSQRQLLLLQLWATVFPASERRHHVLSPLALLAGGFLKLCPVTSLADAQAGLFLCGLCLHLAGSAQRIMPEPLEFATRLLRCAAGGEQPAGPVPWTLQPPRSKKGRLPAAGPLRLGGEQRPAEAWAACVAAAIGTLAHAAKLYGDAESFPEMFAPAAAALEQLAGLQLPEALEAQRRQAGEAIARRTQQTGRERRPLHKAKAVKEVKQFNPRFEEEYAAGKSYDPDRERADERKLKRKLGKEQRSAARELRKDAAFLGDEADRERAAAEQEKRGTLRKNTVWLQSQEADFKSGGQGGLWKRRKRR